MNQRQVSPFSNIILNKYLIDIKTSRERIFHSRDVMFILRLRFVLYFFGTNTQK